ncbi:MAG: hypothetical protein IH624_11195 [Phycisphaerae bacterium]|nr:hypothetical protein [Phycisphaerae bacterium]
MLIRFKVMFVFFLAMVPTGCSKKSQEDVMRIPVIEGKATLPCVAVFIDKTRVSGPSDPGVVLAVWDDGTAITSKKTDKGGPPYYQSKIPTEALQGFFHRLNVESVLIQSTCKRFSGFDSPFMCIYVRDGHVELLYDSWHEIFEADGECVATQGTVEALEGRDRNQVIAAWSQDYRMFRKEWQILREQTTWLVLQGKDEHVIATTDFKYKYATVKW